MGYEKIPPLVMAGMKRYVENRVKPGHFLTAVIQNDLGQAVGKADLDSYAALKEIVQWFWNEVTKESDRMEPKDTKEIEEIMKSWHEGHRIIDLGLDAFSKRFLVDTLTSWIYGVCDDIIGSDNKKEIEKGLEDIQRTAELIKKVMEE